MNNQAIEQLLKIVTLEEAIQISETQCPSLAQALGKPLANVDVDLQQHIVLCDQCFSLYRQSIGMQEAEVSEIDANDIDKRVIRSMRVKWITQWIKDAFNRLADLSQPPLLPEALALRACGSQAQSSEITQKVTPLCQFFEINFTDLDAVCPKGLTAEYYYSIKNPDVTLLEIHGIDARLRDREAYLLLSCHEDLKRVFNTKYPEETIAAIQQYIINYRDSTLDVVETFFSSMLSKGKIKSECCFYEVTDGKKYGTFLFQLDRGFINNLDSEEGFGFLVVGE